MTHYFDRWAIDYESIVNADKAYCGELLSKHPWMIFRVSDACFKFLFGLFEKEIRKGIADNWEVVFSMSKERFVQYHQLFMDELKPHFLKRPGLWFYMFRHTPIPKNDTRNKCLVYDPNFVLVTEIQKTWGIE